MAAPATSSSAVPRSGCISTSPTGIRVRMMGSNTQIGSTLSGALGPNQQLRYLDVFSPFPNGVGAPGARVIDTGPSKRLK